MCGFLRRGELGAESVAEWRRFTPEAQTTERRSGALLQRSERGSAAAPARTRLSSAKECGGSGAGVNIQPVAFLVIKDGCVRTIQLSDSSNSIDRALTMLPELVDKVSALLKKEEKKGAAAPAAPAAEE